MKKTILTEAGDERNPLVPRVGAIGLSAILILSSILSVTTARECHFNLKLNHIVASFTPSLLFGIVTWFWWVAVAIGVWSYAKHRPSFLQFSVRMMLLHLGIGCILSFSHIAAVEQTIVWDSAHWSTWGHAYLTFEVWTPARFGVDLMIYLFIYGFSGLLFSQYQPQQALVQKLELERQLSQAQLKALQMQMERHFLFNTLNAITSLIAQGSNKEAMKTMAHLNTILRTTLQRKTPEKVPFAEELRVVESYLAIQQVRFAGRLEVRIDATPEALEGLAPCFLLQPIVENAI